MFIINKFIKIIIVISICGIILIIGYLIFIKKSQPEDGTDQKNGEEIILNSKKIENKVLESNGEGFPTFLFQNNTELVIAPYQLTRSKEGKLLESYGILVFREINGELEKIDKIEYSYCPDCFLYIPEEDIMRDLNNDGVKELFINIGFKSGNSILIYIWSDESNKLMSINPVDSQGNNPFGTGLDINFQLVDIEKDSKIEAVIISKEIKEFIPPNTFIKDIYKRIYKWDGGEEPYYFWKEEKIEEGVEN